MFKNFSSILLLLISSVVASATANTYDFPFDDALVATIIGTPKEYRDPVDFDIPRKERRTEIFPDREVSSYVPRPRYLYSIAAQEEAAPLIFVIAGTGGSHRGAKMRYLEAAFYEAGMHVVSLSSPTYANFVITASSTHMPGHAEGDAQDLYRVMETILQENKDRVEVTDFYVTGYSLGGFNAAFVSKLDEERKAFNFKKVLMINPPVNLFESVGILDKMLDKNIPGPAATDFNTYLDDLMERFTEAYALDDDLNFNDEFLYRVYEKGIEEGQIPKKERLEALIGTSFRLSSANMITTADFATQSGYIFPKGHEFSKTETTTPYFKVAVRTSFVDYINDMYVPYYKEKDATATRDSLVSESSLKAIESYLRNSSKIGLMHNVDDIILAPGEIDYIKGVFGDRAKIYPRGGHCGNMAHRDNLNYTVSFFKN